MYKLMRCILYYLLYIEDSSRGSSYVQLGFGSNDSPFRHGRKSQGNYQPRSKFTNPIITHLHHKWGNFMCMSFHTCRARFTSIATHSNFSTYLLHIYGTITISWVESGVRV